MSEQTYSAVRRTDAQVVEAFRAIDQQLGGTGEAVLQVSLAGDHQKTINLPLNQADSDPAMKTLLGANASLAVRIVLSVPVIKQGAIIVARDGLTDTIVIRFAQDAEPYAVAQYVVTIRRNLSGLDATPSIDKLLGEELSEFYRRREVGLAQLEAVTQRLIEQNEEYRRDVDKQSEELRQKIVTEQQDFLEKTRQQYEEKEKTLKARDDDLEARKKQFDDRDSRHVRRQIRDELKRNLAEREKQFTLSKATNSKRRWIHAQFGFLILISAVVAYGGFAKIGTTPDFWFPYVRSALGVLGVAASTIFYIRWSDDWFRQHANEEFRLRRLELDIDRASWVVEMALEWKQEKGEAIPPELIERLTTNMFARNDSVAGPPHPVEQLIAALMNASANMKLNLPGGAGEVGFDKKGMQQLAKT